MSSEVRHITLSDGQIAIVDAEDYPFLNQYSWYPNKSGIRNGGRFVTYAATKITLEGRQKTRLMHRMILGLGAYTPLVDHKDHNGLNNTKQNLRLCTSLQNKVNCKKPANSKNKYKGVRPIQQLMGLRWRAQITLNGKRHHIGTFATEEDAAKAYDKRALELFGEFACLNFPGVI